MTDGTGRDDGTIRAEATLLRLPVFALAVKGSATLDGFEYVHVRRRGGRAVELLVRTERAPNLPYPGPLARRVHMAVLAALSERGLPIDGPFTWSWRDLCRRMGLPCSGRRDSELKAAIRAAAGLAIHGLEGPPAAGPPREPRRLYEAVEFFNEPRADGTIPDANRLWLAPWYLDSLNALHAAPIDYALWKRLEKVGPLASRLYEYLVPAFYKREAVEAAYDRLARAMPVAVEARRSHAIRQFARPLAALRDEGILADAGWGVMKGTDRPKLLLARGPRLAPRADLAPSAAPLPPAQLDPAAIDDIVSAYYRLLGRDVRPFPSDAVVARGLVERYGLDVVRERMAEAVRRMKVRFRNAESMGAVVRYFDEAVADAERARDEAEWIDREAHRRAVERARGERGHALRRAAWEALPEARRRAIRAAVLAEFPALGVDPRLLDAACLNHLTPDDLAGVPPIEGRRAEGAR